MRRKPTQRILELLLIAACLFAGPVHGDDSWTLAASDWSRPRSGDRVLEMAPVANAVRAWQDAGDGNGSAVLLLVHPGGEEGTLWAAELRDWLIALGIPSQAIELVAGSRARDRLEIRLRD